MIGPQVAFAHMDDSAPVVTIWARVESLYADGGFKFYAINGQWSGIWRSGFLRVNAFQTWVPAVLVWQGEAPFSDRRYNEAIEWIQKSIDSQRIVC